MKKLIAILLILVMLMAFIACGDEPEPDDTSSDTTGVQNSKPADTGSGELDNDNVITPPIYVEQAVENVIGDALDVFEMEDTYGNESKLEGWEGAKDVDVSKIATAGSYEINEGGEYRLFGVANYAQIYIKAVDQDVVLVLDGVTLTNQGNAPAIYAEDCSSLKIILTKGTVNTFSDTASNSGENAVIRVRSCDLTIDGQGTLNINGNSKHAISTTKKTIINGGNFNLNAVSSGMYAKKGLTINGGKFNIEAEKSAFKSGDDVELVKGFVEINSCSAKFVTGSNGINCYGPVTINNGRLEATILEGNAIDAYEDIVIKGGTLILNSEKRAIKTDANLTIEGNSNVKIVTRGNGLAGKDITISTTGVVYIVTTPHYSVYDEQNKLDGDTQYVLVDNAYVKYDEVTHGTSLTIYARRECRGIEANNKLVVQGGILAIDSYEDSIKAEIFDQTSGKIVLSTTNDGVDATTVTIKGTASLQVISADKGIKAEDSILEEETVEGSVTISGGNISLNAASDSIKSQKVTINGGTVYLFDKIDTVADDGSVGRCEVNGGTVIMLSTTKKAQTTEGEAPFATSLSVNKEYFLAGAYVMIFDGDEYYQLSLPKNYNEKLAIYFTSSDYAKGITVNVGTLEDGVFKSIVQEVIE